MTDSLPTIVLVHGALTDASVWRDVTARLLDDGFPVLAPPLPLRSLEGDVAALRGVLETIDGECIVVGHSYGGSVISDPAALTNRVRGVVFVAAFQQDADETAAELNYRFDGSGLQPETTVVTDYPGGKELALRPESFVDVYASDVDARLASVMAVSQRPIDPSALDEKITGTPTWRTLPSWVLVATNDHSYPTEAQRFAAERAGSVVRELDSSHAVPAAHPAETAEFISSAALTLRSATSAG